MKELYIRAGNSVETQRVLIIGEEDLLGSRDLTGYKPSKGQLFESIIKIDPYSGGEDLTYVHVTPNIPLDTAKYSRDYDVHQFVKRSCKDLVKWDGEANEGLVRSREAFIVNPGLDVDKVAKELYKRIEKEIHFKTVSEAVFEEVKRKALEDVKKQYHLDDLEQALKLLKNLSTIMKHMKR
jgi:hypothetical protein